MSRSTSLFAFSVVIALLCLWGHVILSSSYDYENPTLSLIDPASLNVKKLKALLDQRGVSYLGVYERKELAELVLFSGVTTELTVTNALSDEVTADRKLFTRFTNFTTSFDYQNMVEFAKDSIWIVQVRSYISGGGMMNLTEWMKFSRTVSRFGINVGHFDCFIDTQFCYSMQWNTSHLRLGLTFRHLYKVFEKPNVTSKLTANNALGWVSSNLAQQVSRIDYLDQLEEYNLQFFWKMWRSDRIRVILVSNLDTPPMFFSVLSTMFAGIQFGMIDLRTPDGKVMAEELNCRTDSASYVILTPEMSYRYGYQTGEVINIKAMALLLSMLQYEFNDITRMLIVLFSFWYCIRALVIWDMKRFFALAIVFYSFAAPSHLWSPYRRICFTSFAASVRADAYYYSIAERSVSILAAMAMILIFLGFVHFLITLMKFLSAKFN